MQEENRNNSIDQRVCYVDVTQLVHWQGYVAGIPRVMYEISRRFKDDDHTSFIYVSWVKEVGAFCQIDFVGTMKKRGEGIIYIKNNVSNQKEPAPRSRKKDLYEVFKPFKKMAKSVIVKAGLSDAGIVKSVQDNLAANEAKTYKQVELQKGDSIFISWGEWWDENFLQVLENGVSQHDLKIIPIIHDVLPFTGTPHFSGHSTESLTNYCRRIVPISTLVLCVSKSTRDDLAAWLKDQSIEVPVMEVFRLGEDFEFASAERPRDPIFTSSGLRGGDYMLTVGTLEARKNHTLLYYVHKLAKQRGVDLPVSVIVGRRGWKTEQIYDFMSQDPEVKDKFIFLHNASDENLSWLYDHALISIFASFAEGWGMPIAESIARGVPCVCSNTTSMVEIAEDYVCHFSPASTDECLNTIVDMLKPERLSELREKCKQYKQTTWDESYGQVRLLMKEKANV